MNLQGEVDGAARGDAGVASTKNFSIRKACTIEYRQGYQCIALTWPQLTTWMNSLVLHGAV